MANTIETKRDERIEVDHRLIEGLRDTLIRDGQGSKVDMGILNRILNAEARKRELNLKYWDADSSMKWKNEFFMTLIEKYKEKIAQLDNKIKESKKEIDWCNAHIKQLSDIAHKEHGLPLKKMDEKTPEEATDVQSTKKEHGELTAPVTEEEASDMEIEEKIAQHDKALFNIKTMAIKDAYWGEKNREKNGELPMLSMLSGMDGFDDMIDRLKYMKDVNLEYVHRVDLKNKVIELKKKITEFGLDLILNDYLNGKI